VLQTTMYVGCTNLLFCILIGKLCSTLENQYVFTTEISR
jgi:hypothetical protein